MNIFLVLAPILGVLGGLLALTGNYVIPFTEEDISHTREKRSISEYNNYCKDAGSIGLHSNIQLSKREYDTCLSAGFRKSIDDFGHKCWYNIKTNTKLGLFGITEEFKLSK
tara:strand:- start:1307 stop:1639 length:333 start_codon:yes stop_codon:yes gene_type:complete